MHERDVRHVITDLDMNGVTVFGQRVDRPSSVSVSDWLAFWERIVYRGSSR